MCRARHSRWAVVRLAHGNNTVALKRATSGFRLCQLISWRPFVCMTFSEAWPQLAGLVAQRGVSRPCQLDNPVLVLLEVGIPAPLEHGGRLRSPVMNKFRSARDEFYVTRAGIQSACPLLNEVLRRASCTQRARARYKISKHYHIQAVHDKLDFNHERWFAPRRKCGRSECEMVCGRQRPPRQFYKPALSKAFYYLQGHAIAANISINVAKVLRNQHPSFSAQITRVTWMGRSFPGFTTPARLLPRRFGFNPRPGHSGFSHVGMVPDDTVGRRVFSGISRFPLPFHSGAAPITLIGYQDLDVKSRPNLFTRSLVGETGEPRENPPTSSMARRHDSNTCETGIEPGSPWRELISNMIIFPGRILKFTKYLCMTPDWLAVRCISPAGLNATCSLVAVNLTGVGRVDMSNFELLKVLGTGGRGEVGGQYLCSMGALAEIDAHRDVPHCEKGMDVLPRQPREKSEILCFIIGISEMVVKCNNHPLP
ncbi:hypothetical protein PR048_003738 [Dryococelus australis]|uniref:Uncharacterized protein n=1 Tax=Dryococelus australis TaxID=614101 RepID=A0ABQ9INY2_9NEOP|nr:hypothetical protein PR048_003738 [Dryococelus australis]